MIISRKRDESTRARVSSVDRARQEIPVCRLTDKKRRASPVWRRAWLCPACSDEVWHRGYRGRREEDSLSLPGALIRGRCSTASGTEEETGAIGPASGLEH